MKNRSTIAAELLQALRVLEVTPAFLQIVRGGAVTRTDLLQFLDDALSIALDQTYIDFAERVGGVPSIRQVSAAGRAALFSDMADSSLEIVQGVAGRVQPSWSDERLNREIRTAVQMGSKEREALKKYAAELKDGSSRAKERKLRDRRFDRSVRRDKPLSQARLNHMVDRYRERLSRARMAGIARDQAAAAEQAAEFAHWSDRAAAQDQEALRVRKFWDHRDDNKVRTSHFGIPLDYPDGLPLDEAFVTRWGVLRYPLDSQAHPRDKAGCRCKLRFKVMEP